MTSSPGSSNRLGFSDRGLVRRSILALLPALALSASDPTRGSLATRDVDVVRAPAVILARATGDANFVAADPEGGTGAIYEARLEIQQVIAGDMPDREADAVRVRLMAGNFGYLARGAILVVALDPARINRQLPIYWRPLTTFACVETAELNRLQLRMENVRTFTFEDDSCSP